MTKSFFLNLVIPIKKSFLIKNEFPEKNKFFKLKLKKTFLVKHEFPEKIFLIKKMLV